jgi:D-beta-D-heptose 7-phosphate kinase/D-beta-D-heptose 1-phosphate adenosyltransferase
MKRIFTNGCFDLLHVGHVRMLQYARSLGDVLIVGVNTDSSFRRCKGRDPIIPEDERREMLLALEAVNVVELFDEDTPWELIERIRPDVLVKGPEYADGPPVGSDLVHDVRFPVWGKEHSTRAIIKRIRHAHL